MGNYFLSKKALDDLNSIWNYTYYKWSEEQADKYYRLLITNCKSIADNPELGKAYELIFPDLQGIRVGMHIIFYKRIANNDVEIIRILHGSMDLENQLSMV